MGMHDLLPAARWLKMPTILAPEDLQMGQMPDMLKSSLQIFKRENKYPFAPTTHKMPTFAQH